MKERANKYLVDIQVAMERIEVFTDEIDGFEAYQKDLKTKSAVERQLAIIGEALMQLRNQDLGVEIENSVKIIGLRNRLIHAYDSTEDTIIWAILKLHLPKLKREIQQLLS